MNMNRYALICLVGVALLSTGCAKQGAQSSGDQVEAPKESSLPKWFIAPKAGCAAGVYEFKGSLQAARDGATERARRELARNLEVKIKGLIKDYIQEGAAEGETFSEELVTNVSKSVTATTLNGVRVVDGEIKDERYYSYVCLDTEAFAGAFDAMQELSDKQRTALRSRAKKEFADLDKEIEALEGGSSSSEAPAAE
jgi:hypothetical protein